MLLLLSEPHAAIPLDSMLGNNPTQFLHFARIEHDVAAFKVFQRARRFPATESQLALLQ
jgi:hypothetical protein